LRETVKRCEENVPFYRKELKERDMSWKDVRSLEDLRKLPFTTKEDIQEQSPFGMLAVPLRKIRRIYPFSRVFAGPVVVGCTANDLELQAELMARSLASANCDRSDIIQVAYCCGIDMCGLGFLQGAEKLGAAAIPTSGGDAKRQVKIMMGIGTTMLCSTLSWAAHLARAAEEMSMGFRDFKLKSGLLVAEPWGEEARRRAEKVLNFSAFDVYGLSEIGCPGVSVECEEKNGLHVFEDAFLVEVVDPETSENLAFGEEGELIITTINREGVPLLRYRTGDISSFDESPCACGRTHVKMAGIRKRTDDMLKIMGVNVFPSEVEAVLGDIEGISRNFRLVVDREAVLEVLEVEVDESLFSDRVAGLEELREVIKSEIEGYLGVRVDVRLVEPRTLGSAGGKKVKIVDYHES
ncbi:MAG: phenylacetate--CoA ligase, partial [Actinomycetota bacterium]|nr:phenylacetate--CoA ligase [Actinomycetota bacterium]